MAIETGWVEQGEVYANDDKWDMCPRVCWDIC